MEKEYKGGLNPLVKDKRDFKLGALFQLPNLSELPADFTLTGYNIKHQAGTDFCTGFSTTVISELQEGVELSPEWSFASSKVLSGGREEWGQDMRTAFKTHIKLGAVKAKDIPFSVTDKTRDFLADINNYPKVDSETHKKKTYLLVTSEGGDAFDTLKKTIWKWREEKRAIGIGLMFGWSLSQKILDVIPNSGFGHAMSIVGFRTVGSIPYLIAVNSYGKEAGDNGTHLISRSVINYYADIYGAFMFVDKTREDVQYLVDNKIKEGDGWLTQVLKILWALITSSFITTSEKVSILTDTSKTINKITDILRPKPPITPPETLLWDTRNNARYSSRVIMDTFNLTWNQKDILCAVLEAESGFKINATNKNTNGSSDFGIAQINDKWWIGAGKYFASVEEVLTKPEKSIRFMCERYKEGKLTLWVAFNNGSYKRFMP